MSSNHIGYCFFNLQMRISDEQITIRRANLDDAVLISALATTTFFEAYFVQDESTNLAAYIYDSFKPEDAARRVR